MPHVKTCIFSCFSSAGYNNLEVAEYLLEHGADVNAQDKGGLIPLHNAASYGVSLLSINANTYIHKNLLHTDPVILFHSLTHTAEEVKILNLYIYVFN